MVVNGSEDAVLIRTIWLQLGNVARVETHDGLAGLLDSIKVQPDAMFKTESSEGEFVVLALTCARPLTMPFRSVFSFKRWDPITGDDYYYLYNDGVNATTLQVGLENDKKQLPYVMDTWSSEIVPVVTYNQVDGR